jgi:beta-galactosidase
MKAILFIFFILSSLFVAAQDVTVDIRRWSPQPVEIQDFNGFMIDLEGSWLFNPAPPVGFEQTTLLPQDWSVIMVPGEWVMQGFYVPENSWAGYIREFMVPSNWSDKRVKLKSHAIYSECEIFINGKKADSHLGGFTPFETDITHLLKPGQKAIISIKVKNESVADSLASGSQYAVHPLGGITRKLQLLALPDIHVSAFQVATTFDEAYKNATLKTEIQLTNESQSDAESTPLSFELLAPETNQVVFSKTVEGGSVKRGEMLNKEIEMEVSQPLKWDPEHPNLYTLRLTLSVNGHSQILERKVGFRQIEVRANRIFVNNVPIKLRGVCRHEVMPLRGRSLSGNQWMEDVLLFRAGNVNYIRTSHYPPAEELVHACDSLGMFLQVEAPFCWAHNTSVTDEQYRLALEFQTIDMVDFFRSHPSVLIWSLGNESLKYEEYFRETATLVKKLDPTRPRVFSQWGPDADNNELEIGNHHYPGPDGPAKYANAKRPVVFDEYVHLNAYNRFELVTDPGIRDAWGLGLEAMWEKMYKTPSILGGALWAGIDDTFAMNDSVAVGYGTWGPVDGWRREKPEYWHMKKIYSPVKMIQKGNWKDDGIRFSIENRHLFSNINECRIEWMMQGQSGTLNADIAPGKKADITVLCQKPSYSDTMFVKIFDPRNVLVDKYAFTNLVPQATNITESKKSSAIWRYTQQNGLVQALSKNRSVHLNTTDAALGIFLNGKPVIKGVAQLMLLPLNSSGDGIQMTGRSQQFPAFTATAHDRLLRKIEYEMLPETFTIQIWDDYREAKGYTVYNFLANGEIEVSYHYEIKEALNPRQWGLVFQLPASFTDLSWEREGQWNYYPENHIGRLKGTAHAFNNNKISGAAGPLEEPTTSWLLDRNELGSNDFRSTKMNVKHAALTDGEAILNIHSDGTSHIRSWIENNTIKLLVAKYSNLGAEGYFRSHAVIYDKPLQEGDIVSGVINLVIDPN